MKRTLLAAVLAMLAALGIALYLMMRPALEPGVHPSAQALSGPQAIARGEYLVRAGNCVSCHTERGGAAFAGGRPIETPFGTVYASNITPHATEGIGSWSADDFWTALHEGRSRDGHLLYPAFPYPNYTLVTRDDAEAMFAYLRTLPPAPRPNTAHRLRWPYSTQSALSVWRALYFKPGQFHADPARSADWNRGAYLVSGLGHCSACHTTRNLLGASSDMMDLSGGVIPMQNWYAPSLTSGSEAGVADWELPQIMRLLQTGLAPRGAVLGPMAEVVLQSTQYLDPADLRAMAVFLKELPQAPPTTPEPSPQMSTRMAEQGAKLYGDHCAACHGERGEGVIGAYPALAGNRAVTLPVTANLVQVVLGGGFPPSTAGNPRPYGMPPYATVLSDAEAAAVISHVRNSWGNHAAPVSELMVSQQRSSVGP